MIKGVIFDMDGVLIDSERVATDGWIHAGKVLGVEMPLWLIDSFKGAPRQLSEKMFDEHFKGALDYDDVRKIRTDYCYKVRDEEGLIVKPGVHEAFEYIKSHSLKCAVATSTRKESAEASLKEIGVWNYLDFVVYGDQVEHGKPEPDIFLLAAKTLAVNPGESIVVEDSINGIKAGFAAGAKVVHVPDTIVIGDDIRALTYKVCDSLLELPAVIDELNGK